MRDSPSDRRSLRRWEWAGLMVGLLLIAAFPAYRAVEATQREEWAAERETALVSLGHELWIPNCAACHGENGQGVDAPALNSREFLEMVADEQIHHIIAAGVPGSEMPAWWNELGGSLTDEQMRALVAYIRSWEDTAPSRPDWQDPAAAEPSPSPEETPAEEEEPEEEEPEEEEPAAGRPTITVTRRGCEPQDVEVPVGERFKLRFVNETNASTSLDLASAGQHLHAEAGETAVVDLGPLKPGEYEWECLGAAHGAVLGVGALHAAR